MQTSIWVYLQPKVCIEGIEINEIVNNNKKEFVPLFHFRIKLHFISLKSFIVIERVNMLETQTPLTLSQSLRDERLRWFIASDLMPQFEENARMNTFEYDGWYMEWNGRVETGME